MAVANTSKATFESTLVISQRTKTKRLVQIFSGTYINYIEQRVERKLIKYCEIIFHKIFH